MHSKRIQLRHYLFAILLSLPLLIAACGGEETVDPAINTVERYLTAKTTGDSDTMQQLICADLEANLAREVHTFSSVAGVEIEDMTCQEMDDSQNINCDGNIVALYGTEETIFPLTSYHVVKEDGEWKWCGEAE